MTVMQSPPPGASSVPGGGAGPMGTPLSQQPSSQERDASRFVASTAILILGAALVGFCAWIALGSRLDYDRVQHNAYADFRAELAQATAPTGPTEPANAKALLASGTPVAVLSIPAIGLNVVVREGTSGEVLEG